MDEQNVITQLTNSKGPSIFPWGTPHKNINLDLTWDIKTCILQKSNYQNALAMTFDGVYKKGECKNNKSVFSEQCFWNSRFTLSLPASTYRVMPLRRVVNKIKQAISDWKFQCH